MSMFTVHCEPSADASFMAAALSADPLDRAARAAYADALEECGDDVGAAWQRRILAALGVYDSFRAATASRKVRLCQKASRQYLRCGIQSTATHLAERLQWIDVSLCRPTDSLRGYETTWDGGTRTLAVYLSFHWDGKPARAHSIHGNDVHGRVCQTFPDTLLNEYSRCPRVASLMARDTGDNAPFDLTYCPSYPAHFWAAMLTHLQGNRRHPATLHVLPDHLPLIFVDG